MEAGVQPGTLGGINPSDDTDAVEPIPGQITVDEALTDVEAAAKAAEATHADDEPVIEAVVPEERPKGTSPQRMYVVLQQDEFEDTGEPYFVAVGEIEARNASNGLRKAARTFINTGDDENTEVLMLVVPKTMWRPTPVRVRSERRRSVEIGA